MKRILGSLFTAIVALLAVFTSSAPARIRLVTLPDRAAVSLSIEHPTANLLQEERVLTLQKGVNEVDFDWQGVQIDASAIVLEPLDHPDEVKLISVKYPPGENALVWEVYSPRAMAERCRVSYFLDGIGREVTYRAVSDTNEEHLSFKQYIRLRNDSGERLDGVKILSGFAPAYATDLDNGEMRQTLSASTVIPFKRTFTWDAAEKPHDPTKEQMNVGIPIHYVIANTTDAGLGRAALKYGKVRIFQDDGRGTTAFLGEDWGAYTPVSKEMKVGVGESRDIVVTRKRLDIERTHERRNNDGNVVLFDTKETYDVIVENRRTKDVVVSVVDHFDETWDVASASQKWERPDSRTLKFEVPVDAGDSVTVHYVIARSNIRDGGALR